MATKTQALDRLADALAGKNVDVGSTSAAAIEKLAQMVEDGEISISGGGGGGMPTNPGIKITETGDELVPDAATIAAFDALFDDYSTEAAFALCDSGILLASENEGATFTLVAKPIEWQIAAGSDMSGIGVIFSRGGNISNIQILESGIVMVEDVPIYEQGDPK